MTRGKSRRSLATVEIAYTILEEIHPATVRAVCYRLFIAGAIGSMAKSETNRVSRLLARAREDGAIPWEWIVDETRSAERSPSWAEPEEFAHSVINGYRRDYWLHQPITAEVWSEKGTIRGTLARVLERYGVTFRVMHGYSSATAIRQIAKETAAAPVIAFYAGDWDPSGLHMSEIDLPQRLEEYGASVNLVRLALDHDDIANSDLPHFDAATKSGDPRHRWYTGRYGPRCFELDALNPNVLRDRIERAIRAEIDFAAWDRCKTAEQAEHESLTQVMRSWRESVHGIEGGAS